MSTYKDVIASSFFCFFALCFLSCGFFLLPPLEVTNVFFDDYGVTIDFSRSPTTLSVRNGFTLTQEGETLAGQFYFDEKKVRFEPKNGIKENNEYKLKLSSAIEDKNGISLLNDFYYSFSTKKEEISPSVKSVTPTDGTIFLDTSEKLFQIEFIFSEAIESSSFDSSFRISPSLDYIASFSECGTIVQVFLLEEPVFAIEYVITLDTNITDLHGNKMKNKFVSTFSYGKDNISPNFDLFLLSNDLNSSDLIQTPIENVLFDDRIQILFNEVVDIENLISYISIQPEIPFFLDIDYQTKQSAQIYFENNITWGKEYYLKIKPGLSDKAGNLTKDEKIYSICFNNEKNRPVKFLKAFLKNGNEFHQFSIDNQYSSLALDVLEFPAVVGSDAVSTDLYLFFLVSKEAAGINRFTAMDSIDLSGTNNCGDFFIKTINCLSNQDLISQTDFSLKEFNLEPYLENYSDGILCALKCQVEITNTENKGLISLTINKDVLDTLGNSLEEEIVCVVNKT